MSPAAWRFRRQLSKSHQTGSIARLTTAGSACRELARGATNILCQDLEGATALAEYAYDINRWRRALRQLSAQDQKAIERAVDKYLEDRKRVGLNVEPLNTFLNLYSIRASDELRVIIEKVGQLQVFVDAGHHETTYDRARRLRRILDPRREQLEYILLSESESERSERLRDARAAALSRPLDVALLDHWSDTQLAAAGLTDNELMLARSIGDYDELLEIDDDLATRLLGLASTTPEAWQRPVLDEDAEAERLLRSGWEAFGVLAGLTPFVPAQEARRLAAAPIEDWMVFLHPDQRETVRRRHAGPSYVRGGPGTGKTVVALHRAVELSSRFPASRGRILFTTFVRTLPPVFRALHNRIPNMSPDRIHFVHVDELARQFLETTGSSPDRNDRAIESAFSSAIRSNGPWRALVESAFTADYLKDEIRAVIKGRGIDTVDEYLTIARVGRRTPMQEGQRRAVWALKEAWDAGMKERGTVDYIDRVLLARDVARNSGRSHYAAAIVDEAQDIPQVGLEFVHALITGGRGASGADQLTVVGDGAQRVYPGGYRLLNAGVDVRGRTTVLRINFRTTRQIMEAALAIAGGVQVEDLEEDFRRGEQVVESLRDGFPPSLRIFNDQNAELAHVAERIGQLIGDGRDPGDMLIAASANWQVNLVLEALRAAGVPAMPLADYDGVTTPFVKVGTSLRSKGLEFKVVFVPFLDEERFPRKRPTGQTDEERAEERAQGLSRLFVAMTRARDLLFLTASGSPIVELQRAEQLLEWRV